MSETAFDLGQEDGRRFKDSLISQLENLAAKHGVRLANLSTGDYSSGARGFSNGMGSAGRGRGAGRPGTRHLGGGERYNAPEKPYRGEPVLGEDEPPTGDAAKAIREGFKSAQDTESRVPHGAGTEAQALSDAAKYPDMARASKLTSGGSPYLAKQREPLFAELDKDPEARAMLGGLLHRENDRDPAGVLESMANRALAEKGTRANPEGSLKQAMINGFYGGNTARARADAAAGRKYTEATEAAIAKVRGGSDVLEGRTDQGSLNTNRQGRSKKINGEYYSDKAGTEAFIAEDRRRKAEYDAAHQAPAAEQQRPLAGSNTGDLDYLSSHGGHSTTNMVEHPLGEDAGFNPELAARLRAAGEAYKAETGKDPVYGEGDRDIATQQHYWEDSHHGRDYKVARPGHSRHQSGNSMDIPYRNDRGEFGRWLGAGTNKGHAGEFGLHYPYGAGDKPHVEMDPKYRGNNFYRPEEANKPADQPQAALAPNGELLTFGGLGGQLDRESVARIAAAKNLTPRYFDYRDTEAALKYAKGLDRPYESLGFSAGVNSQERFAEEARKRGIQLPRAATAVGQYAPEGGKQKLPGNVGVPTEHYLDPSGKGLRSQVPKENYLEGHHMPTQTDRGTMARAADAIENRIRAEKAAAAEKEAPEAARNPASAKKADEPKEAKKEEK